MYVWTGPDSAGSPWFARGSANAAAILRGEWWRAVTALTLHGDAGHVAGNAVLGGFLLALLARSIGPGMASALMLLSGVAGTLAAAALVRQNFVSIGASTAVFGAVCSLAALARHGLRAWMLGARARCLHSWERRSAPIRRPSLRIRLRRAGGRGGVACRTAEPGRSGVASPSPPRASRWPHGWLRFAERRNNRRAGWIYPDRVASQRWMTLGINLSPGRRAQSPDSTLQKENAMAESVTGDELVGTSTESWEKAARRR